MTFVSDLTPNELWRHFDNLLTIPRGSKNEAAARDYVLAVARASAMQSVQDAAGNVLVRKPGNGGRESEPATVLQSHLDMVNEKNSDVSHDFSKDAIIPQHKGRYLTAKGTTLGSDNGIGIAASLAILQSNALQHGPLEFLFTIDEETGLTGASNLQPGLLSGTRMINLDSEEDGAIYVGCAGGAGVDIDLPLVRVASQGETTLSVQLSGLRGGHSGIDIILQRGNAIKLLARILNALAGQHDFAIADLQGGNMRNAIPREATATVVVPQEAKDAAIAAMQDRFAQIRNEFRTTDPDILLTADESPAPGKALDQVSCRRLLDLILALPHGVVAMSNDIPGLVETSSNLATIRTAAGSAKLHVSNRSSVESALDAVQDRVSAVARLAGAAVAVIEGYPGWQPDLESRLLKTAKLVYQRITGSEPEIKAIHAGLECGIIKKQYPEMDIISIGPQIEFPHSPNERVDIESVDRFYGFLTSLLAER